MDVTGVLFCCTPGWLAGGAGSRAACPCGAPGVEHEASSLGAAPAVGHGAAAKELDVDMEIDAFSRFFFPCPDRDR